MDVQVWTCREGVRDRSLQEVTGAGQACGVPVAARRPASGSARLCMAREKEGEGEEEVGGGGGRFRVSDLLLLTRCDARPPERIIKSSC